MVNLRDYQTSLSEQAADILNEFGLVYLSMEVRTGKTLTALNTALLFGVSNVLFVTKKKAISSVENDYKLLSPDYTLDCINFESIHKISGVYDLIIIDEAHSLGAFPKPSGRVKNIKNITKGKPIIYLSGTPTPESFSQLYHQFFISSFSPFKEYSSFYKWAKHFVTIKEKFLYGKTINDYSCANIDLIKQKTSHLFIDYTQKQAGFDNVVNQEVLTVQMKDSTYKLIDRLKRDLVVEGKDEVILADTAVKLMQKTHQMYSGTVKFESGNTMILDTSKADFIKQRFEGKKIAIFYKFIAEFDMLKQIFGNWTNCHDTFNQSNDLVFLSQIVSGREGISLKTADCLIFFNIDFSALSYFQAIDRLTSKDRVKENKVYWVFAKNGIEHQIYKTVKEKKNYTISWFKKWKA